METVVGIDTDLLIIITT